jgi:RNA polymerase sigma factor (sigma-70 family)
MSHSAAPDPCRGMNHLTASDAELLAASESDAGAFRVLYDRYAQRIHRYHVRRCRDAEAALDLVAETFAQAWCSRRAFRDEAEGSAAPWLYGIARNVLLQSVRRERLEDSARQRLGALEDVRGSRVAPDESWLEGVDELLDTLPAEQRRVLELRVIEDMSYSRIATHLAITPENARTKVHRALKALRDRDATMTGGPR